MAAIIAAVIVFASFGALAYPVLFKVNFGEKITRGRYYMFWLILASAGVHAVCACLYPGHGYDTSCFRSWASRLADSGFKAFYSSGEFNNYPPGYMYVLRVIGMINKRAGLSTAGYNILLKIPPMAADIAAGALIYKFALKRSSFKIAVIAAASWLLNPAVITDSALWGQTDAVYSLCLAAMLYFIAEEKLIYSYFAFAFAILIKPQSFIMTPVLICGITDQVFLRGFDKKVFLKNLLLGLAAIGAMLALCLPFGIPEVFAQYRETLKGSAYFVQNAFNLWGMLGKNYNWIETWASVTGYILLAASVALTVFVFFRAKGKEKVYFCGGLLMLCSYMLSVKMNERYAFAVIIFFLMAFTEKPSGYNVVSYGLMSLSQFFNIAWVLFVFETDFYKYYPSPWIRLYSAFNVVLFAYILYIALVKYAGAACSFYRKRENNEELN